MIYADLPSAIKSVYIYVNEYANNSSAVVFSWEHPTDARIDHYQYQLLSSSFMITNNVSNASIVISSIPYDENVTFSLTVHNCIGRSVSYIHTFIIGKCEVVMHSYLDGIHLH